MSRIRHFSLLSHAWLVTGASVLALIVLGVLLWSPWDKRTASSDEPLLLYCAAGMSKPVAEIISDYQREYGVQVQVTYDTSGGLLSTIRGRHEKDGDVGDLYLSNDLLTMRDAQQKYGVVAETIPVAVNYPVVVVNNRTQQALAKAGKPITSVHDIVRPGLKVVLANDSASISKLTQRVLKPLGVWAKLEEVKKSSNRVSELGTVEHVAQSVSLQDGYVGIVWRAVADQFDALVVVPTPELEGVKEQAMLGVLTRSKQPTAALHFARYLTARDKGAQVLRAQNFEPVPDADDWSPNPEVILSAGAMLMPGIQDTIESFQKREGVKVNVVPGGCGILVSQMKAIKNSDSPGKKFPDAYFACDTSFLNDVQQWFEKPVNVAQNDLLLIVPKGNPKGVKPSLREMARKDLRIGVPHPTNSALGKLADDLLKSNGWHDEVYSADWQDRIVHTDAAHDLVNKMRAGALDLAVVYRSNALSTPANVEKHLDLLELDLPGARATQPFAIAKETRHRYLMQRLLDALVAEQNAARFKALGFHWVYPAN